MRFRVTLCRIGLLYAALCVGAVAGPAVAHAGDRVSSACDLLTTAQLAEIYGVPFDQAVEQRRIEKDGVLMTVCNYTSSDPAYAMASLGVTVVYNTHFKDPDESAERHIKSFREGVGDPNYAFEQVEGLGGAAVLDKAIRQLTVFTEGRMIIFQGDGDDISQLKAMARTALEQHP